MSKSPWICGTLVRLPLSDVLNVVVQRVQIRRFRKEYAGASWSWKFLISYFWVMWIVLLEHVQLPPRFRAASLCPATRCRRWHWLWRTAERSGVAWYGPRYRLDRRHHWCASPWLPPLGLRRSTCCCCDSSDHNKIVGYLRVILVGISRHKHRHTSSFLAFD